MKVYDYYITPEEYEIASKNNISIDRVNQRVRVYGWSKERAITEKIRSQADYSDWWNILDKNGINRQTFYYRVNNGWDIEKAATLPPMTNKEKSDLLISKRKYRKYPKEIVELAKRNGISYKTFKTRVQNLKWNIIKAATTPVRTRRECRLLAKEKKEKLI